MAWLVGAAGSGGAAGGAAAGAAGSTAAGAGAAGTAASTGAASAAGAGAGASTAGTGAASAAETAAGAGTSGATAAGTGAAKGIGSSAAKDFIKDTAKDAAQSTISNEINRDDSVNPVFNTFDPSGIASDRNNKSNIQIASFEKHEAKKPDKEKLPGVDLLHGFVDGVNDMLTSDETKKENVADVSSESGESSKSDKPKDKPKSSLSRFNDTMKSLGQELGAYAKEEGKNFVSQAIASSAQPQRVNPISPGFTGAQVSSDENLKENIEDAGGIIPMMAQIDSYLYNYKPEAQEEYAGTGMMNNDNNLGVMAQDLQENPLTAPAVKTDAKGNLALDTGRLTSINTAMIAELCKKVMELEEQMYGRS